MTKFERAYVPEDQFEETLRDMEKQFDEGVAVIRQSFAHREDIRPWLLTRTSEVEIYRNDLYQVHVRNLGNGMVHLSIKRNDREVIHDWRDLQQIKNMLVGEECEGVELYPAESRLADTANQYHLWVFTDPTFRVPIGFNDGRHATTRPIGNSKNRPFDT